MHLLYAAFVAILSLIVIRFILGYILSTMLNYDSTFKISKLLQKSLLIRLGPMATASYIFFMIYYV